MFNAVLHWVKPPEEAIACVRRVLKPVGRFVAEFGGRGECSERSCRPSTRLPGRSDSGTGNTPDYPGIGEYARLLERDGLEVTDAFLFDRPTRLEGEEGLRHWIEMFVGGLPRSGRPRRRRRTSSGPSRTWPAWTSIAMASGSPITAGYASWPAGRRARILIKAEKEMVDHNQHHRHCGRALRPVGRGPAIR